MDPTFANRSDDAAAPTNLTIGQLAALAGVTAEAIRYYEREGVVPPAARRGTGQYRHYGPADAVRLRFVRWRPRTPTDRVPM